MSAQKRGRQVSPATRGAVAYARNLERSPLKTIQARTQVPRSTISDNARHSAKQAKIHGGSSVHAQNSAAGTRSGRPPLLSQEQIDTMLRKSTSSYEWRRKTWMTVAREVGVTASRTTVERAFHEAGYGRYSPRSKPNLTLEMRQKRCRWCLDHAYWGFILGWDLVIYTDETSVKLGVNRGKIHVTRTKDEEWEPACLEKSFTGYSTFIFWGAIAWNWKGPCYIYIPEEPALRKASITRLAAADVMRKRAEKAAHAERIAVLLAERTAHTRVVSHPGYFNFSPCQRSTRGGIDWYRYQKCVLEPLLLPAYHEFAALHQDRTVYLMQDGASNHTSQ